MTRDWVDLRIAATASSSGSAVRATMATSAPEAANRVATARPIPLLPPVTIAARRKRLISITSSQTRVSAVPHSKASEQGYFGRGLLVPCPDAPPMEARSSDVRFIPESRRRLTQRMCVAQMFAQQNTKSAEGRLLHHFE